MVVWDPFIFLMKLFFDGEVEDDLEDAPMG
jgi:hypothetical protein